MWKTYALVLWFIVLSYACLSGWIGLFPGSWLAILIIIGLLWMLRDDGLPLIQTLLVGSAVLPGILWVFFSLNDNVASTLGRDAIMEMIHDYPTDDWDAVLRTCGTMQERSLMSVIGSGMLVVYDVHPVAALFFSDQLPDKEQVQASCAGALEDIKRRNPEAYEILRQNWREMPLMPKS